MVDKLLLILVSLVFTSCAKDYTCTCNLSIESTNGTAQQASTVTEVISSNYTHSGLQNQCNGYGSTYMITNNSTYTCTVK